MAELHRLRGRLALPDGRPDEARRGVRPGLDAARGSGGRLLELRAATSLARLWRDQGERAEARDLLAPVYGWFTEGLDTPDLKEANALLDELR